MSVPSEDRLVPVVEVRSGLVGHPMSESRAVPMLSEQSLALPVPETRAYNETRGPGVVGDHSPPAKGAITRRFPLGVPAEASTNV